MSERVAIIGAGPSGIALLHSFQSAANKGQALPEIVCFEKQEDWGGLWNYTWRTGTDEYGELVHGSMYRHLWSNGPKEALEFADYTFEEHFGRSIPSFPPREVLRDYIMGRAEKSNIKGFVRFRTSVRNVTYNEETKKFTVTACNLLNQTNYSEVFDYVVVASGHFSVPNVPRFEGFETFPGRILHSHDYRDASEFTGKDVLVIGTSYSGEDLALQCYKFGAKSVTLSYRTKPTGFKWPDRISEVPLLTRVQNKTAYFKDGSSKEVDAILLCTGYQHSFPFLSNELKLQCQNKLWIPGLYKGVVWTKNPKLLYLGMQDQFYTFNFFDVEAWYARDVVLQRVKLPSKEEMEEDDLLWQQREAKLQTDEEKIYFQGDHVKALLAETDYPDFNVDAINECFVEWEHDKAENILTYRDKAFKSVMTGTVSPVHHTEWLQATDDSKEAFLAN